MLYNQLFILFANTTIQSKINMFGVNSIAAWAISGKLDFLIWSVSDAFCISSSTFVAQNYGAKKHHRVKKGIISSVIMSISMILVISITLFIWSKDLAPFLIEDREVIELTSRNFKYISTFLLYLYNWRCIGWCCKRAWRYFFILC